MSLPSWQFTEYVNGVWLSVLGRLPESPTLAYLVNLLENGHEPIDVFMETYSSQEARDRRSKSIIGEPAIPQFVPPGHYYSPIVDPRGLRSSSFELRRKSDQMADVEIDFDAMEGLFHAILDETADLQFPATKASGFRYYAANDMYSLGDALVLAGLIRLKKPRCIIEVGSGFSSAVMLDILDRSDLKSTKVTFIEPYPERLERLLTHEDKERATIIRSSVQEVPATIFQQLEGNDILFLDTTHISKTGSDVNHEVFDILPRLASGVIVHFHDVFEGFEYLDPWIYEQNRSWNELYLLRAFLMYNNSFEVIYFNHAFSCRNAHLINDRCPQIAACPGGGLWLRKR